MALGAGSYAGMGAIAGSQHRWQVGISGTALMAGFKEGADAEAGRDTTKQAVFHALSILAGAGIVAAAWH